MMNFSQGDIIKISNLKDAMLVVSKNEFIKKTGVFQEYSLEYVFPDYFPMF
jgi:hypothetical protein